MRNINIDKSHDSWIIQLVGWKSGECNPVGIMRNPNKWLSFAIIEARNGANDRPGRFLNEYDIIQELSF